MKLPYDCDPIYQAEQREARWDFTLQKLPRCCICGEKISLGERYFLSFGSYVCQSCFDNLGEHELILEEADL